MPKVTYGLYLSTNTNTTSLKPYNKTNLNNVKWNINWKEGFGSKVGECNVRVKVVSVSNTNLTWGNNIGSIRASFANMFKPTVSLYSRTLIYLKLYFLIFKLIFIFLILEKNRSQSNN